MGQTRVWGMRAAVSHYLNPVVRSIASWLPGFGTVTHRGRRSGRTFRTPVNVFRRGDSYLFVLTYGSDSDWVRNVLAAGTCTLRTHATEVRLIEPELIHDPELLLVPTVPRFIERRVAGASEVLRMRGAPTGRSPTKRTMPRSRSRPTRPAPRADRPRT